MTSEKIKEVIGNQETLASVVSRLVLIKTANIVKKLLVGTDKDKLSIYAEAYREASQEIKEKIDAMIVSETKEEKAK